MTHIILYSKIHRSFFMLNCKFCSSYRLVKNGYSRNVQRYLCKFYCKNKIKRDKRVKYSNETQCLTVRMYLNSNGFRAIGRVLDVPFQLVHHWLKKAGEIGTVDISFSQMRMLARCIKTP